MCRKRSAGKKYSRRFTKNNLTIKKQKINEQKLASELPLQTTL